MIHHENNFNRLIHVGIGVDYGQLNATTFEAFGLDQDDMIVKGIREYYHSGRETGRQKSPSEYARDFKEFYELIENLINVGNTGTKRKIEAVFIDPSARGLAEEIKRILPTARIVPADNAVKVGIERVQKLYSFSRLKISSTQEHLIDEIDLYKFNKDLLDKGKEEVLKENDHCMDAKRYYVMGMWRYLKMLLPITERGDK